MFCIHFLSLSFTSHFLAVLHSVGSPVYNKNGACLGSTYTNVGKIQRRLAWLLDKEDRIEVLIVTIFGLREKAINISMLYMVGFFPYTLSDNRYPLLWWSFSPINNRCWLICEVFPSYRSYDFSLFSYECCKSYTIVKMLNYSFTNGISFSVSSHVSLVIYYWIWLTNILLKILLPC